MFYRSDNRAPDQLRPVKITPEFITTAEGSALIEVGNTRVICTASIEESVPQFMRNAGKGLDAPLPTQWRCQVGAQPGQVVENVACILPDKV